LIHHDTDHFSISLHKRVRSYHLGINESGK
jgi:hypothetical protein